jgi:hypothetical protein
MKKKTRAEVYSIYQQISELDISSDVALAAQRHIIMLLCTAEFDETILSGVRNELKSCKRLAAAGGRGEGGMSVLDNLGEARLLEGIRVAVHIELAAMTAVPRWVPAKEYRRYYGISEATLWRKLHKLQWHKAVCGTGKSARYDKFFNPITLSRECAL